MPEFIDRQLNTPYATGSIWYMQGPFNPDVPKEMGYQLPLVPNRSITSGSPTPRRGVRTNIIKPSLN
ncbi:gluconate 2-dehydrogenase subunit gamma [Klebsiella pneumoniae]|uniref:Gluconate 2-dehydrogenase subunit gamma n=1 Tax=Klebsiella pneumoniae TaxID=573 RepID=A0A377TWG8_KLEPN|nr:gluconate 2-dehydrogenase subunit gamma [Klebsiella pneumoniae]